MYVSSKTSKTLVELDDIINIAELAFKDRVGIYNLSMQENNIDNR